MTKLLTLAVLILSSFQSHACIFSPEHETAKNPAKALNSSDAAFFGKLIGLSQDPDGGQEAQFQVIKTFKGDLDETVTIENKELTSCFRHFRGIGSAYYVFAKKVHASNNYAIPEIATFVPFNLSLEFEMGLE